ncbi:hypothetical protein MAELSTROM_57 [Pseudoalteromonas phage Maelstrom]|uniref:hypothetical protein n=1 Tax=Pseudoalteromonas phage Maelstrom TaxID=2065202 RepID=UPI000CA3CD2F|nr:hypothetical protein PP584_gp57 [Pseudoalteromonas phage Maelstrom]AUG84976.1 hypothetical protein MAELSTROM_57 [Pseudoalteromonas phage Maelstrom]
MSGFFLSQPSQDDINYDGFFDGQNLTIPDNTELTVAVTDGFVGIEEGKSLQVCVINVVVTTPGEFFGQKYKYNAKIYDQDASKRDLAMRNLGVLDAQAGFPMTNGQVELTTESIQELWAGTAEARVKFGLFLTDPEGEPDGQAREINFVRGFGYLREKMVKPAGEEQQQVEQAAQQQATQDPVDEPEIDF